MTAVAEKAELRREARLRRQSYGAAERHAASLAMLRQARQLRLFRRGEKIAAYVPHGSEFPVWPLVLAALRAGCELYLPVVPRRGRQLAFVRLDHDTSWRTGAFGIAEPVHWQHCAVKQLDQVWLPLLAFDDQLFRLGQGGGFYDATLAFRRQRRWWRRPLLTGIAFSKQQLPRVPAERWDLQLDQVLTESGLIRKISIC
ncbi:5-formyltetrahydrofolate cyclo-ligase [Chitinilyticum piscinae]|uniref:5-formyltetrahydrofolate cyclo-ligase n=1 Tax=Chitinilyticum piscinae TaxID=2866724 RepID=A0A8J7FWS9_9NEIS|nr:5-formyltetrahydrofolate cyclo-ligase [Chitinilyticum piscinae]MBE9608195.1 5-formyltetrahydrofolate cyclo-ligase [Chitinilyticum piscinae]